MKPIAYMGHYDQDNLREAGVVVTRDKDDLKHQRNGKPDRIDELYTGDQLREVEQQRDELLAAAENLVRVKGRHHTEQAYKALEAAIAKVKP